MKKKPPLSSDDQKMFADAVLNVRPLKQRNTIDPPTRKKISKVHLSTDTLHTLRNNHNSSTHCAYALSDAQDDQLIQSDEIISYHVDGVQPRTLRKLKAGKLTIDDHLDLHGLNIEQARHVMSQFIEFNQSMGSKCLILVHGKGSINNPPRLKSMINHWLPQISSVLAFCSAQRQHGGTGAVYILIKSKKN